jgi:sulfur carrier protein
MEAFSLIINGENRSFHAPLTVSGLIDALGYSGKRVAIERNGEIVPRSQHGLVELMEGDRLEIVVAVGGG